MNKLTCIFISAITMLLIACSSSNSEKVSSPNGKIALNFSLNSEGQPTYTVSFNNKTVIEPSTLGFEFENMPELAKGFKILSAENSNYSGEWEMPWGEQLKVKEEYQMLKVHLQETKAPNRLLNLSFKVFNDGLGFRYEFPEQANLTEALITHENTQFNLGANHDVWWQPGDWELYEQLFHHTKFADIDATQYRNNPDLGATYIPENAVNTPVTMRTTDGLHLSFHEAGLIDYSDMTLKVDTKNFNLISDIVGSDNTTYRVKRTAPFNTPWRTILIAKKAGDLIESRLILNLNEPNKLGDVSWFKPTKYMGIWWEMHLGISTWDMEGTQDMSQFHDGEKKTSKHGATTKNAKRYIDFASKNNIGALLVEGWNTGWEHWIGFEDREGVFDFVTPYPDYDMDEVVRYGREKGVDIIMHHETSAAVRTYEQQQDTAYALMQHYGMHTVKSGYVGPIIPKGEHHHGQFMVNQYNNAAIKAAKYQVAVNAHEPIKPTGLRRTYPNIISREGLRGQEFNAWASDGGNPPSHLPNIAFTRMLAGPIDYTPGIFNIKCEPYKPEAQVNTTLAQQLALYVVIYSPIQMAADLVDSYEGHPAFQFIRDVGVDWNQTKVLNGEVGEFVTIAREERNTGNWFVGSITNEEARDITVNFNFLPNGKTFKATIYKDGEKAHWDDNPTDYVIDKMDITSDTKLDLHLAEGGGFAISILQK